VLAEVVMTKMTSPYLVVQVGLSADHLGLTRVMKPLLLDRSHVQRQLPKPALPLLAKHPPKQHRHAK
jgi:hypothetical protein